VGACYLRVDAAETALGRLGGDVGVGGYAVVHELAVSNLLLGNTVVVDAVNPVPEARASWREAAARAGASLVDVETVLADVAEHRRRVEARTADIPGHVVPTWDEVEGGEWTDWDEARDGRRLLVDSTDTALAVDRVLDALRDTAGYAADEPAQGAPTR
jgi:predicted kinase